MRKIFNKDIKFHFSWFLLFSSLFFTFSIFSSALTRFIVSLRNLFSSLCFWFFFCYGDFFKNKPNVNVTLFDLSHFQAERISPIDFIGLQNRWTRFTDSIGTRFLEYNLFLYKFLFFPVFMICNFLIIALLLYILVKKIILSKNKRPNGYISRPARVYIRYIAKVHIPLRQKLRSLVEYISERRFLSFVLITLWLLNLNVLSLAVNIIAYYYYFICTFNFKSFLTIFCHVAGDTVIGILSMPLLFWLALWIFVVYSRRIRKGIDNLKHMEAMNCGFLKELDVVTLCIGEPGMGKTTWVAGAYLSWMNIFKDDNLSSMFKLELLFPAFPFASFREDLLKRKDTHEIFCLPNVDDYVDTLMDFHEIMQEDGFLYGYDTKAFPSSVNIGNRTLTLREALKTYGESFVMYANPNIGVANFSIKSTGCFDDSDRLKLWDGDFFKDKETANYSHILNQDMLRHGVKVDNDSAEIGAYGYGVYAWAEISKDLGNQNTNAHFKADSLVANAKNEKITHSFMFARHAKTLVDYKVHIRILTDDQRAASIMAEAVGLMSVVSIQSKSEMKLAVEGFDFLLALEEKICKPFKSFLKKRENVRGDITLFNLLLKQLVGYVELSSLRIKNMFGYDEQIMLRQQGNAFSGNTGAANTAGTGSEHVYYNCYWKVYSGIFKSDSHSSVYAEAQKRCGIGLEDIPCYQNLEMTPDEMKYQRSRLTTELVNMLEDKKEEKK